MPRVTDRDAVLEAMREFDRLGRDAFLERYGFGRGRRHLIRADGKAYDAKAIYGVAHGLQHPGEGFLRGEDFSSGEQAVRAPLEALGFEFEEAEVADDAPIGDEDVRLLRRSRSHGSGQRYPDLPSEELAAYRRVHAGLDRLGRAALEELGGERRYVLKLTSGFTPQSGVRSYIPKDLWFGVYRRENADPFVGNPQVYMIVSERGIEYGFGALTHPDDFSNQEVKRKLRGVAGEVFAALPAADAPEVASLADALAEQGGWFFRRKSRLDPKSDDFGGLHEWLGFLKSDAGRRNAGGSISRYAVPGEIDALDLEEEVRSMARTFRPLMESVAPGRKPAVEEPATPPAETFGESLRAFLRDFANARASGGRADEPSMRRSLEVLERCLVGMPSLARRGDTNVFINVGERNLLSTPTICLFFDRRESKYDSRIDVLIVFSSDLQRAYLSLNLDMWVIVNLYKKPFALDFMARLAPEVRKRRPDLVDAGFSIDGGLDLESGEW